MKTTFTVLALASVLLCSSFSAKAEQTQAESEFASQSYSYDVSRLDAYSSTNWTTTLTAHVEHTIIVDGDGDTDLDIYVYDENDNLIASDVDYTDYCVVRVTPKWTGRFRIKIINRGGVYNVYSIEVR